MDIAPGQAPFFFQYSVLPTRQSKLFGDIRGCLATIIVFSESGEKAQERVGRYLATQQWEIIEVKRIQLLNQQQIKNLNQAIVHIYTKATQLGIGSQFDTW